jgi:hypothetical protein
MHNFRYLKNKKVLYEGTGKKSAFFLDYHYQIVNIYFSIFQLVRNNSITKKNISNKSTQKKVFKTSRTKQKKIKFEFLFSFG